MHTALTVVAGGVPHDVLVDAGTDDTVADLCAALGPALGQPVEELWSGPALLRSTATLAQAGLAPGQVLHTTAAPLDPARAQVEARVVSGPDAGLVLALPDGETRLGAAQLPACGAPGVSVLLTVGPAGVVARPGTGSAQLDGVPLERPTPLGGAAVLEIGGDLVQVGLRPTTTAATTPVDGLLRVVTRPPRLRPSLAPYVLDLPGPPVPPEMRRPALLPLVLPLVLGVIMAFLLSPLFLLFAVFTPLLALGTWWSDRRTGRAGHLRAVAGHDSDLARAQNDLAAMLREQTRDRRDALPDAAAVLATATGPGPRLWERRPRDDDRLVLRLGSGDRPSAVQLTRAGIPQDAPVLRDVPVPLDLAAVGVAGLAGPAAKVRALARAVIGQAVVHHSPVDLQVWLLADPDGTPTEGDWAWLRWLPHTEGDLGGRRVGIDADSLDARLTELHGLVSTRRRAAADVHGAQAAGPPDLLVVLDGARALRASPRVADLLRDGPAVGVHVLCLEVEERLLPEECQAVAVLGTGHLLQWRRAGEPVHEGVRADLVTARWAEQVARALAPLRPSAGDGEGGQVPPQARLLDVLQLPEPTGPTVLSRWGQTSQAVVGLGTHGAFVLDLERDGPHALVAGTTGAGKSELLQTLVASLALANRPDAMTFVLVDYKGGAAFQECARLPHTVGLVTDLDGPLVERALASLTAELTLRERMLAEAGTKDLADYWADGSPSGPLPRLVLIIDEFASLADDLPDFVHGLVGIAQRGRSLGVHLVLATQRPSGVVSPEIRANTNLRIALRVTDAAESQDVLDSPEAAAIPVGLPGRAAVRTGPGPVQSFQTARVGGRAPGATERPPVVARAVPWRLVGAPAPPPPVSAEPERETTDLYAVVEAARAAADLLGGPPPRRPWLDPLPDQVTLDAVRREVGAVPAATGRRPALEPVLLGLEDLPARQARGPLALDLEHGGHLLVVGAPRSGRTTLLRTLAGSLASSVSASDAHLYVVDCGGGLGALASLPHCGAVVTRAEPDRVDRLLTRLLEEVTRRQSLLAARGVADVAQQRQVAADPLPYLVLLLDRWEGFTAAFDDVDAGRLTEAVLRLLREGPGAGLRIVLTGDRTALAGRLTSAIDEVLVLPLADRGDYALAGLAPRQVPSRACAGRAVRASTGTQVQIALLSDEPGSDRADPEVAALTRIAAACTGRVGRRPFRIDPLPAVITWSQARALDGAEPGCAVAVGGDELQLLRVDLHRDGPGFVLAGPARSGRSTALCVMAEDLLLQRVPVLLLTPRASPLRGLDARPGVLLAVTGTDPDPATVLAVLERTAGPLVVLVDDAELLEHAAVGDLLQQVLRDGGDRGHALVLAGTTEALLGCYRGFALDARRSRSGLLLTPTSSLDGEVLGVRLARSAAVGGPPGRGLLVRGGQTQPVQVPVPDTP